MHLMVVGAASLPITLPATSIALLTGIGIGLAVKVTLGTLGFVAIPGTSLPIVLPTMTCLLASSADAVAIWITPSIFRRVFVPVQAMGPITPIASASPEIFQMGDYFQMGWVDAVAYLAEMIEFVAFTYRTDQLLIHQPVSKVRASLPTAGPVTLPRSRTDPEPAFSWISCRYVFRKQFIERHVRRF